MKLVRKVLRRCSFLIALAAWFLAVAPSLALAQAPDKKPAEASGTDYVMPYAVVILGIILGMLVVARASHRRDRDRPAQYVEKSIMKEKD